MCDLNRETIAKKPFSQTRKKADKYFGFSVAFEQQLRYTIWADAVLIVFVGRRTSSIAPHCSNNTSRSRRTWKLSI